MSTLTLFLVVAAAVACGIAVAPYVGIAVAAIGALLLAAITLFIAYGLLRASVVEGTSFAKQVASGIRIYFRALPRAWKMFIGASQPGQSSSIRSRINGFVVLFVCLLWALVVVGAALLILFQTHARI
jgi:hypothetical protein